MARIYHIATRADWDRSRTTGSYTTSTRGRTLEQVGFIHAARRDQVPGVFRDFYADVGDQLLLLAIDPDRLSAEVREERVGDEIFPHIYGPLERDAVVSVEPLNAQGGTDSFLMIFIKEMSKRMAIATAVMVALAIAMLLFVWLQG